VLTPGRHFNTEKLLGSRHAHIEIRRRDDQMIDPGDEAGAAQRRHVRKQGISPSKSLFGG
jgi:hypothetical protein